MKVEFDSVFGKPLDAHMHTYVYIPFNWGPLATKFNMIERQNDLIPNLTDTALRF